MNRNFTKLILTSGLIIASIGVQAYIPSQIITYQKPDPTKFVFSVYTTGAISCSTASPPSPDQGGGTIQGYYDGAQQSQTFTIPADSWSQPENTVSFSGDPTTPQPIPWTVWPFNQCISYASGVNGLIKNTAPGPINGITKNTVTSQYTATGQPVYTVTSGVLDAYLPDTMNVKDNTTGEVIQYTFVGCSDYLKNNYGTGKNEDNTNLLSCCYTISGTTSDCQVNK